MHVVVVGGSGFIGRSLINRLCSQGKHLVTNIDPVGSRHRGNVDEIKSFLSSKEEIEDIFEGIRCKYRSDVAVFHLGGMGHRGLCDKSPKKTFFSNVTLTTWLLTSCIKYGFQKFIFPSSGLVYRSVRKKMLSEDSELDGSSVYAAAKITAEKVIKELSLPSNVQCFVVRMANVYGPESGKDTLFGTILSQAANDKDVITLRDLRPRNDFVYIEDVVRCFEKLIGLKGDEKFFLYNVSCGCSHSVLEIAEKVCKEMKMCEKPIKGALAEGDVQERILSNKKIRHEIDWTPEYSIDRGIKESIVKKTGVCS